MYNRLDTIPACDGQTAQTIYATAYIVRAMHTRRAVKTNSQPHKSDNQLYTQWIKSIT